MANSCKSGDEPSEADSSNEPAPPDDSIQIIIKPQVTREIEGISQLDRKKYFSVADPEFSLEDHLGSEERIRHLILDLGVKVGRLTDSLKDAGGWRKALIEDLNKPGHVDLANLEKQLSKTVAETPRALAIQGDNLDLLPASPTSITRLFSVNTNPKAKVPNRSPRTSKPRRK